MAGKLSLPLDPVALFLVTLGVALALYLANRLQVNKDIPLPPGPKRLPLIGNYLDLPTVKPWLVYKDWAEKYGDIIYMYLPLQPVIILNSARAAFDLMEKRSSLYSDRPFMTIDEMTGWDWNFSILPYGPRWRDRRRIFHQYFNQNAITHYHHVQLHEIRTFLRRLLADNFSVPSARLTTAAIIVGIVYGKQVKDLNDDYITLANKAFEVVIGARKPGAFWVDYIPFLRHIPSWVPGAASAKFAVQHRPIIEELRDQAFYAVKKQFSEGTANPSVVRAILEDLYAKSTAQGSDALPGKETAARDATSGAFLAAVDTSLIGTLVFVLAMAMHPDIQRKAQAQLDEVLEGCRLPTFEDSPSLPYIHAIILEALRWMPPAPLGLPHRAMKNDEYNGLLIPEGSLIFPNIWAMLHDPEMYPDPETFNPGRFLTNGVLRHDMMDPSTVVFGFGRRICPGRFMGRETLFITAASLLSVFDILPALGPDGKPVTLSAEATNGLLSYPENVQCMVRPRDPCSEQLIRGSI